MAYNHDLQGWRLFIQSTPCKPLGVVCRRPQEPKNETPRNAPKRNIGNLQDKLHIAFGAFLFAPPLETATSADYMTFRNTTKAKLPFFGLCISP